MEAKTLTLVERLKSARDYLLTPKVTIVGPVQEIELRLALAAEAAITALEAAQKALEPFAEQANRMDASDLRMGESKREDSWEYWVKTGDLRLARSVHSMLIGEDKTKGDIKEANHG